MKKKLRFISIITLVNMFLSIGIHASSGLAEDLEVPSVSGNFTYGDITNDGIIDAADYTMLRKYLMNKITELPNPQWKMAGDLNGDSIVDSDDYFILRKYLIGAGDIPVKVSNNDVREITDIIVWNDPVKPVFEKYSVPLTKVKLNYSDKYTIYRTLKLQVHQSSFIYINNLLKDLAIANNYYNFKLVDGQHEIEVLCDPDAKAIKTYTVDGIKDYFKFDNKLDYENSIIAGLPLNLQELLQDKRKGNHTYIDLVYCDLDNDNKDEIIVTSTILDTLEEPIVDVYKAKDLGYERIYDYDIFSNKNIFLPHKFINLDNSNQKHLLIDYLQYSPTESTLGYFLYTINCNPNHFGKYSVANSYSVDFRPNAEGFYEKVQHNTYKNTLQNLVVDTTYSWENNSFVRKSDKVSYGNGQFIYPDEPLKVIRCYLEAKMLGLEEESSKFLIDASVKELFADHLVRWEDKYSKSLEISNVNVLSITDSTTQIEISTGYNSTIVFSLVKENNVWKISDMKTALLQITTTKDNILNEDDFNVNYKDTLINYSVTKDEALSKLGVGEDFNPDMQKDVFHGNSQRYDNTYYNYPNSQTPNIKISYSNLDSRLYKIDLLGVPTNRGLKVGDPGSKALELYGYPNEISNIYSSESIDLSYNLGQNHNRLIVLLNSTRTEVIKITLEYDVSRFYW